MLGASPDAVKAFEVGSDHVTSSGSAQVTVLHYM